MYKIGLLLFLFFWTRCTRTKHTARGLHYWLVNVRTRKVGSRNGRKMPERAFDWSVGETTTKHWPREQRRVRAVDTCDGRSAACRQQFAEAHCLWAGDNSPPVLDAPLCGRTANFNNRVVNSRYDGMIVIEHSQSVTKIHLNHSSIFRPAQCCVLFK